MTIATAILIIFYLWMVNYMREGWVKLTPTEDAEETESTGISIVVAYRDESDNLSEFLQSIEIQDYAKERFELILVDDHSSDDGAAIVEKFKKSSELSIHTLQTDELRKGKRSALELGIEQAKFSLIATTDADTTRLDGWLKSISRHYEKNQCQMIIAPVLLKSGPGFFARFQQIEFLSLQLTTLSFAGQKNPILNNGANLIFEKQAFEEVGGYGDFPDTSSGDDFFLLMKMKLAGFNIHAIRDRKAAVFTYWLDTVQAFVSQRSRWASKTRFARDRSILLTAILNTLLSLWMIILPILEMIVYGEFRMSIGVWLIRLLGDFYLLDLISREYGKKINATDLVISFVIYPFYISYIFIHSLFGKNTWKGRPISGA